MSHSLDFLSSKKAFCVIISVFIILLAYYSPPKEIFHSSIRSTTSTMMSLFGFGSSTVCSTVDNPEVMSNSLLKIC